MDELLRPVQSSKNISAPAPLVSEVPIRPKRRSSNFQSSDDFVDVLENEPDIDTLRLVGEALQHPDVTAINIRIPSAATSKILRILLDDILPLHWPQIEDNGSPDSLKSIFIQCLRSLAAVSIVLSRLKALTPVQKSSSKIAILLSLLASILNGPDFLLQIWTDIQSSNSSSSQKQVFWREAARLVSSGQVVSTSAEANAVLRKSLEVTPLYWICDGSVYSKWLASNISFAGVKSSENSQPVDLSYTIGRALSLGYPDAFARELVAVLVKESPKPLSILRQLCGPLKTFEKTNFLGLVLKSMSRFAPRASGTRFSIPELTTTSNTLAQTAAFLRGLSLDDEVIIDHLFKTLLKPEIASALDSIGLIRAILATLRDDEDRLNAILEQNLATFADSLFIQHAPVAQQETVTQVLLLVSGYVNRDSPILFRSHAKSSQQLNAVSHRLASSSVRVRWLGMIVGMSFSALVDKPENRMKFEDESLKSEEAKWYLALPQVDDKASSSFDMEALFKLTQDLETITALSMPTRSPKPKGNVRATALKPLKERHQGSMQIAPRKVTLIEEGDDLVPYAKPDSDPEDEDEDPTLVNRDKPKAPVYIRDLIAGLKETENYDKHQVALSTAASLVRRKAEFGKEVADNIQDLADTLINLNDTFELDNFLQLKQEALIAVLLADPTITAEYFARMVFEADLSLQQRTMVLTTLGLGARELAGYKDEDRTATESFPSKTLPSHLHAVYSDEPPALSKISSQLERSVVEPIKMRAADELTGPNVLKMRTFSSRIAAEKRTKIIPNKLAKIVAENFFFPLAGRWWTYGKHPAFTAHFLSTYLKTLAIILHASGPSTLSLPQMTSEFWTLLLSLRSTAITTKDYAVIEALMFSFLIILEINEDKERLAREQGKDLLETQESARIIMEKVGGEDEESARVKELAASVLVRCHEVIEKFQRLMIGDMVGYY